MLRPSTIGPRKSATPSVRPSLDAARKPGASSGARRERDRLRERAEPEGEAAASQARRSLVPSYGDERPQRERDEEPDEDVDVLVLADEEDRDRIQADPDDQQPADRSRGREPRQHQVEHHDDRALRGDQRDSHRQEERDVERTCDVIDQPDDDERERRPLDDRRRDVRIRSARELVRDLLQLSRSSECAERGQVAMTAARTIHEHAEHDEDVRRRRRKPVGPSAPRRRHARASGSVRIRRQPATSTTRSTRRAAAARRSPLPASRCAC